MSFENGIRYEDVADADTRVRPSDTVGGAKVNDAAIRAAAEELGDRWFNDYVPHSELTERERLKLFAEEIFTKNLVPVGGEQAQTTERRNVLEFLTSAVHQLGYEEGVMLTIGHLQTQLGMTKPFEQIRAATPPAAPVHPEDFCQMCKRPNVVWFAPSPLWNKAVREKGQPEILCPACFIKLAEQAGIDSGAWKVSPEFYVTPDESPAAPAPTPAETKAHIQWIRDRLPADVALEFEQLIAKLTSQKSAV